VFLVFSLVVFCFSFCTWWDRVRVLQLMAGFKTALIHKQNAACKSMLIDLAKAERRWTEKNDVMHFRDNCSVSHTCTRLEAHM
jgi:hypothetical protein